MGSAEGSAAGVRRRDGGPQVAGSNPVGYWAGGCARPLSTLTLLVCQQPCGQAGPIQPSWGDAGQAWKPGAEHTVGGMGQEAGGPHRGGSSGVPP